MHATFAYFFGAEHFNSNPTHFPKLGEKMAGLVVHATPPT